MKSVLLNTTVIGSSIKLPRHPKLILGEPGKYVHGDILDANAVTSLIDSKIAALVNNAPEALDTLKEIADSLGNDANLAASLFNKLQQLDDKITDQNNNQTAQLQNAEALLNAKIDALDLQVNDRCRDIEAILTWVDE